MGERSRKPAHLPNCSDCGRIQTELGGLRVLVSPPNIEGRCPETVKEHLCGLCFQVAYRKHMKRHGLGELR